jgi:hypothetical protein
VDALAVEILGQCPQVDFVGDPAAPDFGFVLVQDWQLGHAQGKPSLAIVGRQHQRRFVAAGRLFHPVFDE